MNFIDVVEQTLFFEEAGKSLLLLDIDDTLLKAQGIKIYRKLTNKAFYQASFSLI